MINLTRAYGYLLIVLAVFGYILSGMASFTALIPAIFGGLALYCAHLAENEQYRMHAMHGACGVGILGLIGNFKALLQIPTLISNIEDIARPLATVSRAAMG